MEDVSKFRALRESVFASREDVIRLTRSVSLGTLRNLELNRPVRSVNAQQLIGALNKLLKEANKPPVKMHELGIRLQVTQRKNAA